MNESFSDQESGRRFVVVSAAVAICLLGTLLYLSTSSRRLKNRNAPSGAQTGVLRAAADAPANFPASAAELAPAANTISRHSSPTNRAQGNPRQPVKPPLVLTLGDNLPSERRPFGSPGALARASATGSAAPKTGAAKPITMVSVESFSKLPLSFEANVGQVEQIPGEATFGKDHVGFLSQGRSYALLLASDEAVLALRKPGVRRENRATRRLPGISGQSSKASDRVPQAMDVVRTKLQGASGAAKVTLLDELPGRVNYFIGNDPKKWRTDVPTYAKVKYQGVYPGIDLVYYGSQRQLEYDFVVAPGADPKAITLAVEAGLSRRDQSGGIKPPLRIDANGDVVVEAEDGEVRFHKPVAYQPRDWSDGPGNSKFTIQDSQFVDGRYVVTAGSRVHFDISAYDHSKPLIIDPVLSYSTFAGGNSGDFVSAVALDSSGNAYVTGKNDAGLVFVTKLSSDGTSVVYNTVVGSGYESSPQGIAVDALGRAYITGAAGPGFPTTAGAFQASVGSGTHAFVTVLDPTGASLVYSSYLAGSVGEQANGVAFDASGNVYVTGSTESSDFPTTPGAFQTTFGTSTRSGFVAKINPAAAGAASLVYSTFLGGAATPASENAIAADAAGNAYVTGSGGPGFPTTSSAFAYTGSESGSGGVFVTKLNPAGASLVYSAYLGFGEGTGIAVDGAGNAYVTGLPQVSDFPTTSGAYQTTFPSGFVTKLNPAGSALVYSTFLSGPGEDVTPQGIALPRGCASGCNAYVSGFTSALDFPAVNAIQDFSAGGDDAFVVELSAEGSSAVYSTYLGGSADENNLDGEAHMPSIAVSATGDAVVAGATASGDFPVSLSATSATQGFVAKITSTSASEVVIVPPSLSFGAQVVGVKSGGLTLTLRNMGSKTLNITSVVAAGDFAQSNTCGTSVAGGGSCAVTVTFTPTVHGARTGTVTITDDAQNGPTNVVNLSGTGADGAVLNFSPAALNFGDQKVDTNGAAQKVTLSNIGNQTLTLSGFGVTGDFSQTNNCPTTLAPAASCALSVSFEPTQPGFRSGIVTVSSNTAPGGIQTVSLAGTGTGVGISALTLSTNGLAFGNQALKTTSPPQTVTVTNSGNVPVTISSVAASGDFALTNNCPSSLSPAASCPVNVTFTPAGLGVRTGTVTITDSTSTSPELVSLKGTGVNAHLELSVNPSGLDFFDQAVGTTSSQYTVTVANPGNVPVTIGRVLASGDFEVTPSSNCVGTLAPAAQCRLGVAFTPTTTGPRSGQLSIIDNAPGSPQTVSLVGNGLVVVQTIVVTPTSMDFPDQVVGTVSNNNNQNVTIINTGNVFATISNITVNGDFSAGPSNCGSVPILLGPGQSCNLTVNFSPTAAGSRTGALTFTDSAVGSPQTVALAGQGEAGVLTVNVTPTGLDFPDTAVNSTSNAQQVSITNTGNTPVGVSSLTATGDFALNSNFGCNLPAILQIGQTCSFNVNFTPTATGVRSGMLSFNDDVTGSPQTVALMGNGVAANLVIAIIPSNMDFGPVTVGATSPTQSAVVRNIGNEPVVISSVVLSAGDFSLGFNGCETTLQPTQECNVQLSFAPTAVGARTASVTFTDNAQGSPQTMTVTGQGTSATPAVTLSPAEGIFDAPPVGTAACCVYTNLYNNTKASLTISSVVPSGDFALQFNNCPSTLGAGGSCSYGVNFTPTAGGIRTGKITITDSDPSSPQVQSLAGLGIAPTQGFFVSPTGLSFSNQVLNTISPQSQFFALSNTGNTAVTVSKIAVTGDFSLPNGNNCGTVYGNNSCQVSVAFRPAATGTRTGTVTITDSAPGSPHIVSLTGQGVSADQTIAISSLGLAFPDQTVSTTSQQQYVVITNTGNTPVSFSNIVASGDFSMPYDQCIGTLQPSTFYNSSCSFAVNFTPTAAGARTGAITITDNAVGGPHIVSLTGKGLAAVQSVVINPPGLAFSDQAVGTSNTQGVSVTNVGNSPVFIKGEAVSGADFSIPSNNNCSNVFLGSQQTCSFVVNFTPTVTGPHTGSVTITDGAPGSPQTVALTGNGVSATQSLTVSPSNLAFGKQQVGLLCTYYYYCQAASQTVSLTNSGTAPITVSNLSVSPGFFLFTNCGQIAPRNTCNLPIYFAPTATGPATGALTIIDSAPGSPHTVALSGTGISPNQIISLSQTNVAFGTQTVGLTSNPIAVYYVNQGNPNVSFVFISSIAASGDFAQTNNCGNFLAGGTSCSIFITLTPAATGGRSGTLTITDNASGSPRVITLTGTGTLPAFSAAPASLSFGAQAVGVASAAQPVTVTNTGAGVLVISSLVATGDFGQTNNCPIRLPPGASCTVIVTFTPSTGGNRTGAITFTDNAPGSPQVITLSGSGGAEAGAGFSTTSVLFGNQDVSTTSASQTVALTNTGNAALAVTAVALAGSNPGDFARSGDTCSGANLAPTNSCTVAVTFTPTAAGSRNAVLRFTDNAGSSPQLVILNGTGAAPAASLSSPSLTFGAQFDNTASAAQTVTLTNAGNAALNITGIVIGGTDSGDFAVATTGTTCATSSPLNAGTSCTISVTFTPTAVGTRTGALTIAGKAPASPVSAALSGTGTDFTVAPASGSQTTATVVAGQSATYTLAFGGTQGFTGTVALTCTDTVQSSSCTDSPTSISLNGTTAVQSTVTVTTTARSMVAPGTWLRLPRVRTPLPHASPLLWWLVLALGLALAGAACTVRLGGRGSLIAHPRTALLHARRSGLVRRIPLRLGFPGALLMLLLGVALSMAACGGGGGVVSHAGTLAGTYTVTVTATATSGTASLTHKTTLTLTVQ